MVAEVVERAALDWLRRLATETGAFRIVTSEVGDTVDHVVTVLPLGGERLRLAIEVKSRLTPQEAISQVHRLRGLPKGLHGVLSCPFVSPRVAQICREAGVGYFDEAGNCRLEAPGMFVLVEGRANRNPDTRTIADPFAPKSSRIVRLMLQEPQRKWQVQELAEKAGVSIGLASKTKERLLDEGYLWDHDRIVRLHDPAGLLRAWSETYKDRADRHELYVMGKTQEIERNIQRWCEEREVSCGLTELSGAWRVAPMVRYLKPSIYVENQTPQLLGEMMADLDARLVDSGANVSVWMTTDPSVFWQMSKFNEIDVVSAVQLYLDLAGHRGRMAEAAQEVFDRCLAEGFNRVERRPS